MSLFSISCSRTNLIRNQIQPIFFQINQIQPNNQLPKKQRLLKLTEPLQQPTTDNHDSDAIAQTTGNGTGIADRARSADENNNAVTRPPAVKATTRDADEGDGVDWARDSAVCRPRPLSQFGRWFVDHTDAAAMKEFDQHLVATYNASDHLRESFTTFDAREDSVRRAMLVAPAGICLGRARNFLETETGLAAFRARLQMG